MGAIAIWEIIVGTVMQLYPMIIFIHWSDKTSSK